MRTRHILVVFPATCSSKTKTPSRASSSSYATGTGIHFTDRPAIESIIAKTKASQHGILSLVQEVVASELFQTK